MHLKDLIIRFIIGGFVVSLFSLISDLFKPKDIRWIVRCRAISGAGIAGIDRAEADKGNSSNRSSLDDTGRGGAVDLCLGCKLYGAQAQAQASGALGIASITSFMDGCSRGFVVTCIELTDDCR